MRGMRLFITVLVGLIALGTSIALASPESGEPTDPTSSASPAPLGTEVPAVRTADSRTYELPDGRQEVRIYTSPVNYFRRTATVDCELGDHSIRAGEKVTLWYPSGNRDASVFADPHRFDITRSPNHHMAFGAGGPHYCLGASLAKLELKVMFEGLVKRLPDIEATGPAERLRNNLLNSIKHLPVKFTPAEPVLAG